MSEQNWSPRSYIKVSELEAQLAHLRAKLHAAEERAKAAEQRAESAEDEAAKAAYDEWLKHGQKWQQRATAAEALLTRYREALEEIRDGSYNDWGASALAREALKEPE